MLETLWALFVAYVLAVSIYLLILTIGAYLFHKKAGLASAPLTFAVVIPAHNEALQIRSVVESVRQSDYPDKCFDIIVIADNCEDDTASRAEAAGAQVYERTDLVNRGKGQALDWFFKNHEKAYAHHNAVVIIDADTRVDPRFLQEMSNSLADPEMAVVQGFYGVANPEDNWRTSLLVAALAVFHHLRPAGRNRIGGSAGLRGNGMAFRTDILKKYGWPAHSIVEDIEFTIQLLAENILVHYNPDAVVLGEMAIHSDQAETQRRRWEGGRFHLLKTYAPMLLRRSIQQRRIDHLDMFMDLLTPPLGLLVLNQCLLLTLGWLLAPMYMALGLVCLSITTFYVFSGLWLRRAPVKVWLYLLSAPVFILWKIPIYLKIITSRRQGAWERTQRRSELGDEVEEDGEQG